jgi:hypothetical protein
LTINSFPAPFLHENLLGASPEAQWQIATLFALLMLSDTYSTLTLQDIRATLPTVHTKASKEGKSTRYKQIKPLEYKKTSVCSTCTCSIVVSCTWFLLVELSMTHILTQVDFVAEAPLYSTTMSSELLAQLRLMPN